MVKAIGFIFSYIDEKDDSNFELGDADDLYISEGYVKKEFRKNGIYTALNKAFEKMYLNNIKSAKSTDSLYAKNKRCNVG